MCVEYTMMIYAFQHYGRSINTVGIPMQTQLLINTFIWQCRNICFSHFKAWWVPTVTIGRAGPRIPRRSRWQLWVVPEDGSGLVYPVLAVWRKPTSWWPGWMTAEQDIYWWVMAWVDDSGTGHILVGDGLGGWQRNRTYTGGWWPG